MTSFVRVVERGSFAAAAETLGLTPAMVGNHIRFLEHRLGARLLNRTTRRQSLTELGHDFYGRCSKVLGEVEEAEAVAHALQTTPRGVLRVTAPVSLGTSILPMLIADYLQSHPAMEVELTLSDAVVDLMHDGFEVGIRVGELADVDLVARALRPYRVVLCAARSYVARKGIPSTPTQLSGHACLDFMGSSWQTRWPFADGTVIQPQGNFRCNNGQALLTAVREGLGIGLLPELLVRRDIATGKLIEILPGLGPAPRPMSLLTLPDRWPSAKIRSFTKFLAERLGPTHT